MILTNRLFTRKEPDRNAHTFYIFSEGLKREYDYFNYFLNLDSRIKLIINELNHSENNSPNGLLDIAKKSLIPNETNNNEPQYELIDGDEVWIVFDTDLDKSESREQQIIDVNKFCKSHNWKTAESNPCFEVWLYYHLQHEKPTLEDEEKCSSWKNLVDDIGPFDSRRHPIYIEIATENSEKFYIDKDGRPDIGSTQLYEFGKSILPYIKKKIDQILHRI